MTEESGVQICLPIAVAPMMDWTDRHCRYFLRLLSPSAMLYTEMITAAAIHHGDYASLLASDESFFLYMTEVLVYCGRRRQVELCANLHYARRIAHRLNMLLEIFVNLLLAFGQVHWTDSHTVKDGPIIGEPCAGGEC